MNYLWGTFSQELESAVFDDLELNLDTTKEQFLERVRRLAVSHVAEVAKVATEAKVIKVAEVAKDVKYKKVKTEEVMVKTTPHAEKNVTNQEKETAKISVEAPSPVIRSIRNIRSIRSQEFSAPQKPSLVKAPTRVIRKPSGSPQEAPRKLRKLSGSPQEALRSSSSPPPRSPPPSRHPRQSQTPGTGLARTPACLPGDRRN